MPAKEAKIATVESHGAEYNGIGDSNSNSVSYTGGQGHFFCMDSNSGSAPQTDPAALDAALKKGVEGIAATNHNDAAEEIINNAHDVLGPDVIQQAQAQGFPLDMYDYTQGVQAATGPAFNQLTNLCDAALKPRTR